MTSAPAAQHCTHRTAPTPPFTSAEARSSIAGAGASAGGLAGLLRQCAQRATKPSDSVTVHLVASPLLGHQGRVYATAITESLAEPELP